MTALEVAPCPFQVAVLADHPLLAEGLHQLLEDAADVHVVSAGTNAEDAAHHLDEDGAQLVVGIGAALSSPIQRLLDRLEFTRDRNSAAPPAICVVPADADFADLLLSYGNRIIVLSADTSAEDLLDAIRAPE